MSFSNRLSVAMATMGISATELSQLVRVSNSTISRYLSGDSHPNASKIRKLADALGVTSDWLCGPDIDMTPKSDFMHRLKDALAERNLSATKLSARTGISNSTICRYLQGKISPSPKMLKTISTALSVDPMWLAGYDLYNVVFPIPVNKISNEIDLSLLTPENRGRVLGFYQALLETQDKF